MEGGKKKKKRRHEKGTNGCYGRLAASTAIYSINIGFFFLYPQPKEMLFRGANMPDCIVSCLFGGV